MKKMISFIMLLTLCTFVLAACGNSNDQSQTSENVKDQSTEKSSISNSESSENEEESEKMTEQQEADNTDGQTGKVLVVYYSATGNTKAVADVIADDTGGDTFELIPVDEYTDEDLDWTKDGSRVNREHEDESLQDIELVSTTVEDFDSYDTVFIGYPIWWHNAAWSVNNFVKNNDFTGKTVIPFCTSSSSGLGESGTNLAAMAGTGDWQEGKRFSGSVGEDEVRKWLADLDF